MTDATCRPVATPLTVWERERQGDRMTELLECLADLLVHTAEQRATIERAVGPADSTKNDGRDVQSMSSRPSRTRGRGGMWRPMRRSRNRTASDPFPTWPRAADP